MSVLTSGTGACCENATAVFAAAKLAIFGGLVAMAMLALVSGWMNFKSAGPFEGVFVNSQ